MGPDSPLGRAVQRLLEENPDGLHKAELLRRLRQTNPFAQEQHLNEILAHPDTFSERPGGIWILTRLLETSQPDEPPVDEPPMYQADTLDELPAVPLPLDLSTYVVFDFETSGFDPKTESIIQFAAIRVEDGRVVDGCNLFARPTKPLPLSLQQKLNLDEAPDKLAEIYEAPPIDEQVHEIVDFLGSWPLVAHNGRFDYRFLKRAMEMHLGCEPTNALMDTMELALLAKPGLRSYRLEKLADRLGIGAADLAAEIPVGVQNSMGIDLAGGEFHDAAVDVIYLHQVFRRLWDDLRALPSVLQSEILRLLPRDEYVLSSLLSEIQPAAEPVPLSDLLEEPAADLGYSELYPLGFEPEAIVAMFEPEGRLAQQAASADVEFRHRPRQQEMVGYVCEALEDNASTMIEAPTGTGKTLAYLLPAVHWARATSQPVAVSTSTRNLQDQLVEELERLQAWLPFRYQVLKGRANYASISAFDVLRQARDEMPLETRLGLVYLLRWLQTTREGTLDELHYWFERTYPSFADLRAHISYEYEGGCPECELDLPCFYHQALARANQSDLLVINHALLLVAPWGEHGWPVPRALVVDEGHNLEDACTSSLTQAISYTTLRAFLNRLHDRAGRTGLLLRLRRNLPGEVRVQAMVREFLEKDLPLVRHAGVDFGRHLRDYLERTGLALHPLYGAKMRFIRDPRRVDYRWQSVDRFRAELQDRLNHLAKRLAQLKDHLDGLPDAGFPFAHETRREIAYLAERAEAQARLFMEILLVQDGRWVYWLEVEEYVLEGRPPFVDWALKKAPLRVGPHLHSKIYDRNLPTIFTSATLTTAERRFEFFADRLGLTGVVDSDRFHKIDSEFPYEERALLVLADYLEAAPRGEDLARFKPVLTQELAYLLRLAGGRSLCLFTARERMEYAFKGSQEDGIEGLEVAMGRWSIPVFCQERNQSRKALKEEFSTRVESVLLGLKSFWEGIDVPGKSLSFVVMEKLPFPMMGEPLIQARAEQYLTATSLDRFTPYILPLMLIQFKQGFGRLIRRHDDYGVVILYDRGIHRKGYKPDLLASLPGYYRPDTPDRFEADRRRTYEEILRFMQGFELDFDVDPGFWDDLPSEGLATGFEARMRHWTEVFAPFLPLEPDRFDELRPLLLEAMQDLFGPGFVDFRSQEQAEVVKTILAGQDVLGLLPTGAGKSFCFQFPALIRQGLTLVISPLIALMKDQVDQLHALGIEAAGALTSGMRAEERERILQEVVADRVRLLYVAPERLRDPKLVAILRQVPICQLVVDEAHCVATWGTDFRPDFLYIYDILERMDKRPPTAALTATATENIRDVITERLNLRQPVEVIASFDRPEVKLVVYNRQTSAYPIRYSTDKLPQLLKILHTARQRSEITIVYVARTGEAEQLARQLRVYGINALPYHGRMISTDRQAVQEEFMAGTVDVVVATKAFGLGINKADVRYIIHYDMPGDLESYYQEVGRSGRDGLASYGVLLYHPRDRGIHDYFRESATPDRKLLDRLYSYLRERLPAESGTPILLDPGRAVEALSDREELDETRLKVMIHLFEEWGLLRRDVDFALKAAVTVNRPPDEFLVDVGRLDPAGQSLAQALLNQLGGHPGRFILEVPALASSLDRPLSDLDEQLTAWDLNNLLIYRAFERGYLLVPTEVLRTRSKLQLAPTWATPRQQEREDKLKEMIAYSQDLREGQCRRRYILGYFGEDVAWNRCGACSNCPPLDLPWAEVAIGELPKVSDYVDPALIILEAHAWNVARAQRGGHQPKGHRGLESWLVGNDFYGLDPTFPYFNILSQLGQRRRGHGRDAQIEALTQRLVREGYVEPRTARAEIEGQIREWMYYELTEKGQAQRGISLDWT